MVKKRILQWRKWLYGLIGGAIGGGATVISALPVGAIIGAADYTPRQLVGMFVSGAIVSAALYLKQSPVPEVIEVDEP